MRLPGGKKTRPHVFFFKKKAQAMHKWINYFLSFPECTMAFFLPKQLLITKSKT